MPRRPRIHVPAGFYHITMRGNYRQRLFGSPEDRFVLNTIIAKVIDKYGARVHGFCWMTNHIHMILQVGTSTTGEIMRPIATGYARHRHRTLNLKGHLFERRYHAPLIDGNEYFLQVLRYVHLNPVDAGIVFDPARYRWSSHRAYLGLETIPWLTTDFALSIFGETIGQARAAYEKYMKQAIDEGGARITSTARDPRIIGSDAFASQLPVKLDAPRSTLTIEDVVESVCRKHAVSVDEVRSASRERYLAPPRAEIAAEVRNKRIASLTQLGTYLRRDPSVLSRLISRHRPKSNGSIVEQ